MEKAVSIAIWAVLFFGIWGSYGLAKNDWIVGNVCPKIIGIPACYIILVCFMVAAISHSTLVKDHFWLYFIGAGLAWSIATVGTVGQTMGWMQCPTTAGGIPMCYISFAMFSLLLGLKFLQLKVG